MATLRLDQLTESTSIASTDLLLKESAPTGSKTHEKISALNFIKSLFKQNLFEKGASIDNPPAGYMTVYADSTGFFYTKDESGNLRSLTRPATFEWMPVAAADNCAAADVIMFTIPSWMNGMNLTDIHARNITAGTTGVMTIQVTNVTDTQNMLSTALTIDSAEVGSDTAATPAVIDGTHDDVATNDLIKITVTGLHTTPAKGLIIRLEFNYP